MDEKFFESKIWESRGSEKKEESKNIISPEATENLRKALEDLTKKYKKDRRFKQTLQELEKIAREQGIEGILIDKGAGISLGGYRVNRVRERKTFTVAKYDKNKICIGEDILGNIRNLFRIDKEFARGGFGDVFCHEKQEHEGPAGKANEREFLEFEEFVKQAEYYYKVVEKISELESKYDPKRQMQVELQRIVKTYKDLNFKRKEDLTKFIEREARMLITTAFYSKGLSYLKMIQYNAKVMELPEIYDFIKPNLHKPILKQMEKMRQKLIKKYDEKVKDMK